MSAWFVAGSHTDVGKTHVACALIRAARARGLSADAFKPVVSGFDPADWGDSDPGRLLQALGRPLTPATLEAISPFRFTAPLAPPAAAARQGVSLGLDDIAGKTVGWLDAVRADLRLVEGVGGVMSPLADDATGLDLMARLRLPAVLVGGSYLGGISHTLTAIETLAARRLAVAAVVVSQSADPDAPDLDETVDLTRRFARGAPVIAAPRSGGEAWAGALLDRLLRPDNRRNLSEPA